MKKDLSLPYFETVKELYLKACKQASEIKFDFILGDTVIRLNFAGDALYRRLTNSFEHLKIIGNTKPRVSIFAWDSQSTGIAMPAPPWSHDQYGSHGVVESYSSSRIKTAYHTDANALSIVDLERSEGVYWIPNSNIQYYEEASPFRTILQLLLEQEGYCFFHAAAVGMGDEAILFVGKSGSGKSTTALGCINSELSFISDDYCLLKYDKPPVVYSLYSAAKSYWETIERLPFMNTLLSDYSAHPDIKAVYQLSSRSVKLLNLAKIKAIFVAKVSNSLTTTIRPISSAQALLASAPSTLFQLPFSRSDSFTLIGEIIRALPCYEISLGVDNNEIVSSITKFFSSKT